MRIEPQPQVISMVQDLKTERRVCYEQDISYVDSYMDFRQ